MSDIAISVRNVSKCYRVFEDQRSRLLHAIWPKYSNGMQEVWALKDINFDIKRGEAVALIGRNGGGKSTLLEILTGTLAPSSGEVKVNGRVSALLELGSGFNPEYSGRDNVMLNGLLLGLTREDILGRFAEIEAFAEIGAAIDRPVKTYSSGMMMRLAFAVQVLCEPDILIIDEALSVGDFFFRQKCLSFIRGLCAKGVTLLFVSHDMGTVRDLCSQGIFLSSGKLDYFGDNLEAIRRYFSANVDLNAEIASTKNVASDFIGVVSDKKSLSIDAPIWCATAEKEVRIARISCVGFVDDLDMPCRSVKLGSKATIQTLFTCLSPDPVHVTVALKNKYGHVITVTGSYTLKTPFPIIAAGEGILSRIRLEFSLEAGDYTFSVSLAKPSICGQTGSTIDETPWLGPIRVDWDYQNEIPPFYGMVGLKGDSVFITGSMAVER
jgi:lipopolysaccharide transport system ATP-binding protein